MMRKFYKVMLTLALVFGAVGGVKAEIINQLVKSIDYTSLTSYPYYWMGDKDDAPNACGGTATIQVKDGALVINNIQEQEQVYSLQFFILDQFSLAVGNKYLVKIDMEADKSGGEYWLSMGTWDKSMPKYGLSIPNERQVKEVEFDECTVSSNNGAHIIFQCGKFVGTVKIYKVELYRVVDYDNTANHMLLVTNGEAKTNVWDYQAKYTLAEPLTVGKTYVLDAAINAVNGGETRVVVTGSSPEYLTSKGLWKNEFTRYNVEFTAAKANTIIEFDLGHVSGQVYFDNVSLVEKGESTNLIANGDFETPLSTAGWTVLGGQTIEQVENALGVVSEPGVLVTVGEAGWRSFRTGTNMKISDANVKAYAAKYIAAGNYIQLTEVTEVQAWEPVLIEAPQGYYSLEIPASITTSISSTINDLKANGGSNLDATGGTIYALGKKGGVVGFYRVSDYVPAWTIYMEIPTSSPELDFIGFDGGTTSISEVDVKGQAGNAFFNLNGQRVAQPTKGLYIVNGKKVVIK
jgi:hypothetical protein